MRVVRAGAGGTAGAGPVSEGSPGRPSDGPGRPGALLASAGVYLAPDDAKTDVILAAAAAVLGVTLRGFVITLPLYPRPGLVAAVLDLGWIVVVTALVPVLLVRHRRDGASGLGFGDAGIGTGLLLAVPAVVVGLGAQLLAGAEPLTALLGRLAAPATATLTVDLAVGLARVVLFSAGALVLYGFLASRAREGFPRSPDVLLTRALRLAGLGAVGLAAVTGLVRALTQLSAVAFGLVLLNVAGLAAVLLLADRLVPAGLTMPRTVVITPLLVLVVANIFATGGLFRGDLVSAVYGAALGAGLVLPVAALAQTRAGIAPAVPLVVVVHWFPTCLSPLTIVSGLC